MEGMTPHIETKGVRPLRLRIIGSNSHAKLAGAKLAFPIGSQSNFRCEPLPWTQESRPVSWKPIRLKSTGPEQGQTRHLRRGRGFRPS